MTRSAVHVLLAAAVGFCAPGLYVLAWDAFVTDSCRANQVGDCVGAPIAMALVGLPVLYVVWAAGLRATGARYAALAPLVIGLVLFGLVRTLGPYDTAPLVWLTIAAVLSGGWRIRFGPQPPVVSSGR